MRNALAKASTADQIRRALDDCRTILLDGADSPEQTYVRARVAASVAYYRYLLGASAEDLFAPLDSVEFASSSVASLPWSSMTLMALNTIRHRLFRNFGDRQACESIQSRQAVLVESLCQHVQSRQEVIEWGLEQAHFSRYLGHFGDTAATYFDPSLVERPWHPVGNAYQRVLAQHYRESFVCEWSEVTAVPGSLEVGDRVRMLRVAGSALGRMAEDELVCKSFPMFWGHHVKHRGLFLAIAGEREQAAASLAEAAEVFEQLGLKKPQLLVRMCWGIAHILLGKVGEAEAVLHQVQVDAEGYYPHAANTARFHLARLCASSDRPEQALVYLRKVVSEDRMVRRDVTLIAEEMTASLDGRKSRPKSTFYFAREIRQAVLGELESAICLWDGEDSQNPECRVSIPVFSEFVTLHSHVLPFEDANGSVSADSLAASKLRLQEASNMLNQGSTDSTAQTPELLVQQFLTLTGSCSPTKSLSAYVAALANLLPALSIVATMIVAGAVGGERPPVAVQSLLGLASGAILIVGVNRVVKLHTIITSWYSIVEVVARKHTALTRARAE